MFLVHSRVYFNSKLFLQNGIIFKFCQTVDKVPNDEDIITDRRQISGELAFKIGIVFL